MSWPEERFVAKEISGCRQSYDNFLLYHYSLLNQEALTMPVEASTIKGTCPREIVNGQFQ